MMQIKNKLHLLSSSLISCLGLFFLMNINQVMAMNPNFPGTSNNQPSQHNLTIEENIIYLKQKIYDNATTITNINKTLKESVNLTDDEKKTIKIKNKSRTIS
ncbi:MULTISPECIES: SVM family protein [Candidatus Phytoplasma]|uniref:Effector n=2 Tax=Candidatus Phytoplasma TaxID=33926 RepID=A0ABN0J8F0_PEWBP|nr:MULTISPECIES: SVM family protein [Phytoplasma]EMR14735.1 putative effector [Peanut witches'-broom phytoplasma NTU2011]MDO8052881.1 SVM family protein ['Vigna radiata' phytoplasma]